MVQECTAVLPFIWSLVTRHLPDPDAMQQLLHIGEIGDIMNILSLFSDECECRECAGTERGKWYEMKVYSGGRTYRSQIKPAYS